MAPLEVHIKHAGKVYDLNLDPDLPPSVFKESIYQLTGVPVERMKVMVKGGVLKDDSVWKKVAPKAGQTFMVIGAAGELPKAPEKPIVFLEGMWSSILYFFASVLVASTVSYMVVLIVMSGSGISVIFCRLRQRLRRVSKITLERIKV